MKAKPTAAKESVKDQAFTTATSIWEAVNDALKKFAPERGPCFKSTLRDKLAAEFRIIFAHREVPLAKFTEAALIYLRKQREIHVASHSVVGGVDSMDQEEMDELDVIDGLIASGFAALSRHHN